MGTFSHGTSPTRSSPGGDTPTSVYRYYDRHGLLIYVGITSRAVTRNREHNATKTWWPFVARQEVDHYDSRVQAAAAEKKLIQKHRPPFNTVHNPDHEEFRAAYLAFAETADTHTRPAVLMNDLKLRVPLRQLELSGRQVFSTHPTHAVLVPRLTNNGQFPVRQSIRDTVIEKVEQHGPVLVLYPAGQVAEHRFAHLRVELLTKNPLLWKMKSVLLETPVHIDPSVPLGAPTGIPCPWPRSFRKPDQPCKHHAVAELVDRCPKCRHANKRLGCRRHTLIWLEHEYPCRRCDVPRVKSKPVAIPATLFQAAAGL